MDKEMQGGEKDDQKRERRQLERIRRHAGH